MKNVLTILIAFTSCLFVGSASAQIVEKTYPVQVEANGYIHGMLIVTGPFTILSQKLDVGNFSGSKPYKLQLSKTSNTRVEVTASILQNPPICLYVFTPYTTGKNGMNTATVTTLNVTYSGLKCEFTGGSKNTLTVKGNW